MKKTNKQQVGDKVQTSTNDLRASEKQRTSFFMLIKKHSTLFSILTGAMIILMVVLWKDFENKRERASLLQSVTHQMETNQREMLMLMLKPMVWSIRADMLRGNLEQVNLLISDLVKEKNFQFIHIIAPDGKVMLSTNKSFEGKPIGNLVDATLLMVKMPMVLQNNQVLLGAAPILGIDRQIATLVIAYKPSVLVLDVETTK